MASEVGRVTGFFHVGVTVSDLDRSLRFYRDQLGFEQVVERVFTEAYIMEITAVPAEAIRIALLRIPGSDVVLELLEYRGVERHPGSVRPCDYGTGHFCLYVSNIDSLSERLAEAGVTSRSGHPLTITAGPNKNSKALYLQDPDGYNVEVFERHAP